MKVFQCIHKYPPHIPIFEKKNDIESRDFSFNELRDLLIKDGYASTYILKPALEGNHEQVFYTIWDYERLQHKWAEENGLKTRNLDEIKLAQIEAFKPDVFYNHSPRYDKNFVEKLPENQKMKKVCWDAVITNYPFLHEKYDLRVTLFEPFVKYWKSKNFKAELLQPAFDPNWSRFKSDQKNIDVLFYGQYSTQLFSERNTLVVNLIEWAISTDFQVNIHLDYYLPSFLRKKNLKLFNKFTLYSRTENLLPTLIQEHSSKPIYASDLYNAINNSKIVINAFGDENGLFKENMRTYETIGLGALMISEDGIYPDFLEPDRDFLTYKTANELIEKIEYALSLPDQGREMATRAHEKLITHCTKEKQWDTFCKLVENL